MKLKYDLRCHTCGRALFAGDYAFIKDNQYAALAKKLLLAHSQNDETAVVYCSENCLNQALNAIRDFEFPEDEKDFTRAVVSFCDDYLECFPGLCSDGDYKKAYKAKAKKVLNLLKAENPSHYEKFNEAWNNTEAEMKAKLQKRLKIFYIGGGAALAGCTIAGAIISSLTVLGGLGLGLFTDLIFFGALNTSFNSVKETNENNEFNQDE